MRHALEMGDQLLVVGFGPVAARLVDELLPEAAAGRLRITVVGAEARPAYNRVLVGEYAVGRADGAGLGLVDERAWREAGVRLLLNTPVAWIDRSARVAHLGPGAGGDQISYDALVFAVGARANVPVLRGINPDPAAVAHLPAGVTVLRTPEDGDQLRAVTARGGRVVVLGGGVLGLELALAAHEEGCDVTVVHHRPWLLTRSADRAAGAMLEAVLSARGVQVVADAIAREVLLGASGAFTGLLLADGQVLPGDLLILACGTTPRTRVAVGAGLRVDRGILVNHDLEADTEGRVFAIGDCAEVLCTDETCTVCPPRRGRGPAGLIGPGWQQAQWLAGRFRSELREDAEPVEPLPEVESDVIRLKAHTVEFAAAGEIDGDPWEPASGRSVALWADAGAGSFAKLVLRDERLVGFIALGLPRVAAELALRYADGAELPGDLSVLLRLDGPDGEVLKATPSPTSTVCRCAGVTAAEIDSAIGSGCESVTEICAATRAGSGCGGCKGKLQELLDRASVVAG